jgi:hypothetical protein
MKIQFNKDILLDGWESIQYDRKPTAFPKASTKPFTPHIETIWYRYLLRRPNDDVILVKVRVLPDFPKETEQCYVNFYGPLRFLHSHFSAIIDGDLEVSKQRVDEFLIRMSKLTAFA